MDCTVSNGLKINLIKINVMKVQWHAKQQV